jgi:CHAT domain-containing protein
MTFRGRRLFESCPLGILPNLSCLPSLSTDFSPTPRAALIGAPDYKAIKVAPLLQAEVELRDIEQIYLMNAGLIDQLYLGKQATEANFWKLAKHPDAPHNLLHISSHGVFETGDPMSSGLLFSDSKADAAEIMRAGLRYDEVILSACSTGYRPTEVGGVALSGDDILGLPGALLEAGVRSVLVSIPPAREDASQRFMTLYHERRAEGVSPLLACQAVQKEMLKDGAFPPYLWVGFTVYGCQ